MKMSRKWLNEFVDLSLEEYDDHTFGEAMTVSGSKVEVTDDLSKTMHGVKVGRIVSIEKHPNSDHMLVTQIDVGESEPVQIAPAHGTSMRAIPSPSRCTTPCCPAA